MSAIATDINGNIIYKGLVFAFAKLQALAALTVEQIASIATGTLKSYLATTITYNDVAVLADTALSVTVEAATKYDIEVKVYTVAAVYRLNLDFGGTATISSFIGYWDAVGPFDRDTLTEPSKVTAAGTDFSATNADSSHAIYTFRGSMTTNAAGTFLVRGAQAEAIAFDTTILAGSTLVLSKIA